MGNIANKDSIKVKHSYTDEKGKKVLIVAESEPAYTPKKRYKVGKLYKKLGRYK